MVYYQLINQMYNCMNCLNDIKNTQNNRVNTLTKCNILQCNKCFHIDNAIQGIGSICQKCTNGITTVAFDKCGHTICQSCSKNVIDYTCIFCRCQNTKLIYTNDICVEDKYFFDKMPVFIKKYFKKLYCQTIDTIGKDIESKNGLYILCIEYYKFLNLLHLNDNNNNANKLSPSNLIDRMWHEHLLDNESYNDVCESICGYVLFHYPENSFVINIDNYAERFRNSIDLYERTYTNKRIPWIWNESHVQDLDDPIQIFVKKLGWSDPLSITVNKNSAVYKIMKAIEDIDSIPTTQQRLLFKGKLLESDTKISEYGIGNKDAINMILRLGGC